MFGIHEITPITSEPPKQTIHTLLPVQAQTSIVMGKDSFTLSLGKLDDLPPEVQEMVFSFFRSDDLGTLRTVSKAFDLRAKPHMHSFKVGTLNQLKVVVEKFPNVMSLDLSKYQEAFNDKLAAQLNKCQKLEELVLHGSGDDLVHQNHDEDRGVIQDDELGTLLSCTPRLKRLDLTNCTALSDDTLPHIAKLKDLEELRVANTNLGQEDPSPINSCVKLRLLDLSEAPGDFIDDDIFMRAINFDRLDLKKLLKLEDLNISNAEINDEVFGKLLDIDEKSEIKKLNISMCVQLTDDAMRHPAKLENLEELSASMVNITGAGLIHINPSKNLRLLDLDDAENLEGEMLKHLIGCEKLEKLFIRRCQEVTEEHLEPLTAHISEILWEPARPIIQIGLPPV